MQYVSHNSCVFLIGKHRSSVENMLVPNECNIKWSICKISKTVTKLMQWISVRSFCQNLTVVRL